jgi:hypothetical protein
VPWLVISLAGSIRAVHRWHRQDRRYACPCCGHITLWQRGAFELCEVCWWVDDSQDDEDVATVRGGPNGSLSLAGGRYNVRHVGACEACFVDRVRAPRAGESRTGDAKG